jgi:hypothetical protein
VPGPKQCAAIQRLNKENDMSRNPISEAAEFKIQLASGSTITVPTYPAAIDKLRELGCEEIGHSGDLEDGGDRTLAWLAAEDAQDVDGSKAFAKIVPRYAVS